MKNLVVLCLLILGACTPLKRAQTGLARGITGNEVIRVDGHEVYCSEGKVCSEIDVLGIAVEDRDGGKVRVTLKNRTGNTALVQVRLEIRSTQGEVLSETRPENVAIPATQEKAYEMRGIFKQGARLRVIMNTAY